MRTYLIIVLGTYLYRRILSKIILDELIYKTIKFDWQWFKTCVMFEGKKMYLWLDYISRDFFSISEYRYTCYSIYGEREDKEESGVKIDISWFQLRFFITWSAHFGDNFQLTPLNFYIFFLLPLLSFTLPKKGTKKYLDILIMLSPTYLTTFIYLIILRYY